jgi:hypothetical protein
MSAVNAMALSPGLRHSLDILQRAIAAIFAGYGISALASLGLARSLPLERSEAVMAATMIAFLLHACVALWAFAARDALRLWAWLIIVALPFAAMTWL